MTDARCQRLEQLLRKEVPLTRGIGMHVHRYHAGMLELRADLAPNINVHGTAFGGSLYSMGALAGWGLLILKLDQVGLDPRIMIRTGTIKYHQPVMQTIRALSRVEDEPAFDRFVQACAAGDKSRIDVPVEIRLDDHGLAAEFVGTYVAFSRAGVDGSG